MSHLLCRCGYDIRDTSCPSTHEARVVTDMEIDDSPTLDPPVMLVHKSRELIECPGCLRLLIQREPGVAGYVYYLPEGEPLNLAEQQGGYRG